MKRYMVNLYYSTFLSTYVKAENKKDALELAKKQHGYGRDGKHDELLSNLDEWKDAHTIVDIEEGK